MLAAIGAKLKGQHGGLQVDKEAVTEVKRSVDLPYYILFCHFSLLILIKSRKPPIKKNTDTCNNIGSQF